VGKIQDIVLPWKIKVLGTREIRDATLPATTVQSGIAAEKNHLLRSSVAGLLMAAMEFAIPETGKLPDHFSANDSYE